MEKLPPQGPWKGGGGGLPKGPGQGGSGGLPKGPGHEGSGGPYCRLDSPSAVCRLTRQEVTITGQERHRTKSEIGPINNK